MHMAILKVQSLRMTGGNFIWSLPLSMASSLSTRWMEHTGDTVATVMGWLSSTQAGGATTFHNGVDLVRLWPTRGAAGVWYSLYTDGSKVTGYRGNIKTSRK